MAKIYQKNVENNALFLDLWQDGKFVELRLLTETGEWYCTLATISDAGLKTKAAIDMNIAARAGIAIDANGRLKVIGQEVEAVEAERMPIAQYPSGHNRFPFGRIEVSPWEDEDGSLHVSVKQAGIWHGCHLSVTDLRDLRDRINSHLAFLEQEGLA